MAHVAVHSVTLRRGGGLVANVELTHLLREDGDRVLLFEFPQGAPDSLGTCYLSAEHDASNDELDISVVFEPRINLTNVCLRFEAMVPSSWSPPRSGRIFQNANVSATEECVTFSRSRNDLKQAGFIEEDTLRVQIQLSAPSPREAQEGSASHLFGHVFDSVDFSDMVVATRGKDFRVHRNILAARSPVLKSMICTRMSEGINGRLEAHDLSEATAEAFLRFLYTGSCGEPSLDFASITGTWYVGGRCAGKGSILDEFDMTRTLRTLLRTPCWDDFRSQGGNLHVRTDHKAIEIVFKKSSPDMWKTESVGADRMVHTLELKNCLLFFTPDTQSFPEDSPIFLVCKEAEIQFAHFWGRLLCAADKYCVDVLTKLCEERMLARLSVWNAVPMLQYACSTSRLALKQDIMEFAAKSREFFQNVKDMPEFDALEQNLQNEMTDVFLRRLDTRKRPAPEGSSPEFADGQDWQRLSCAQLRRACAERGLDTGGGHSTLVALLQAREPDAA